MLQPQSYSQHPAVFQRAASTTASLTSWLARWAGVKPLGDVPWCCLHGLQDSGHVLDDRLCTTVSGRQASQQPM